MSCSAIGRLVNAVAFLCSDNTNSSECELINTWWLCQSHRCFFYIRLLLERLAAPPQAHKRVQSLVIEGGKVVFCCPGVCKLLFVASANSSNDSSWFVFWVLTWLSSSLSNTANSQATKIANQPWQV